MCCMDTMDRATRKSVPLTPRDLRDLSVLRGDAAHRSALSELASATVTEGSSEAFVLHAVWEAGVRAVRERVEEEGYAQMAADLDSAARKASARRRRPAWTDEG